MEFIFENAGTIAVLAALVLIISLIIIKMRKDKKQGKSGCGCGCEGCAMKGSCHPAEKNKS